MLPRAAAAVPDNDASARIARHHAFADGKSGRVRPDINRAAGMRRLRLGRLETDFLQPIEVAALGCKLGMAVAVEAGEPVIRVPFDVPSMMASRISGVSAA
jgi:hypothetical protein